MLEGKSNELVLIYNSDKHTDKQAKAFVESLPGYKLRTIDLVHDSLGEEDIIQLAIKLKVNIEDLLNPSYDDHISVHNEGLKLISRTEMISLMANDHKIINTPILIIGNRAYRYGSAYELLDKALSTKVNAPVTRNH
jgi:arsenate reductase-like glutaredoxin family protein